MRTVIQGGTIVNEGRTFDGTIVIEDGKITQIIQGNTDPEASSDEVIDASGCFVLPGIIDDHVHFREPGLTENCCSRRCSTMPSSSERCRTSRTVPATCCRASW